MSNEVANIEKGVSPIITRVQELTINSKEDLDGAVELLSQINKYGDSIKEEKDKVLRPLLDATKAERARWKPIEDTVKEGVATLKTKMGDYHTMVEEKAKEEQEKIANRVGEGRGKIKVETAVKKIGEVETAEKNVSTDAGKATFITVKKFEVEDISKLPVEYLLPNEVAIRKAMKEGTELPGVRYYEEKQIRNSR